MNIYIKTSWLSVERYKRTIVARYPYMRKSSRIKEKVTEKGSLWGVDLEDERFPVPVLFQGV